MKNNLRPSDRVWYVRLAAVIYPVHTSVFGSVRYRNGIDPPVHICKCIAHSVPIRSDPRPSILWGSFRNKLFRYSLVRSVCNVDRWIGTVPEQVWTQTVAYRSKLYRNSLYRYGTDPDMDRVIINHPTQVLPLPDVTADSSPIPRSIGQWAAGFIV